MIMLKIIFIVVKMLEFLQVSDCHHGLVFDGLETMFTTSLPTALTILLRAINNRKYIYAITLKFGYETLKEHNAAKCREEGIHFIFILCLSFNSY